MHGEIKIGEVTITWMAGNTVGQENLSVVDVSIRCLNDNYIFKDKHLTYSWVIAYVTSFSGTIIITHNQKDYVNDFSGTFVIPTWFQI